MNAPIRTRRQAPRKTTTMTSREFNQHTSSAKQAASEGPVFITDRGKPGYVLITDEEYRRLTGKRLSLLEALEQKGGPQYDFEIELPKWKVEPLGFDFETDK